MVWTSPHIHICSGAPGSSVIMEEDKLVVPWPLLKVWLNWECCNRAINSHSWSEAAEVKSNKVFLNQGSPKILKYVIKVPVQFLCFWNGQTLLDTWTEKSWNRWDVLWLLFHLICQGLEIRAIQDNPQHYALFLELVNGDGSNTFWQIQILHSEEDQLPLKEFWSVWHNSSLGLKWKKKCEWNCNLLMTYSAKVEILNVVQPNS